VLVPFYTSLVAALIVILPRLFTHRFDAQAIAEDEVFSLMLRIPLYSGAIGLFSLSAFLNLIPRVAHSLRYSLLAWMFLPYLAIALLLHQDVDWKGMIRIETDEMMAASVLILVCFFHVIGIIISFIDFRKTIVRQLEAKRREAAGTEEPASSTTEMPVR
jgi:hypothetical protein